MSHHENSIKEPREDQEEIKGASRQNRSVKKRSYQKPGLPDTFSSRLAPQVVEISVPTASGGGGAQALAEVVRLGSSCGNFILHTR
jgi:hypothetical protein